MKNFLIAAVVIILGAETASARLGETEAQIAERYGSPSRCKPGMFSPADFVNVYKANGFTIFVAFQNDASVLEMFSRADGGQISPEEFATLRAANSYGMSWQDLDGNAWRRSDSAAVAELDFQKKSVTFLSQYFVNRVAASKREAAKKTLSGF
ncbi:MAG: hypothetical protein PHI35_09275 [Victivallaceae bacterium]|nr:hypothetical protein [Victivallaceae bacterium]